MISEISQIMELEVSNNHRNIRKPKPFLSSFYSKLGHKIWSSQQGKVNSKFKHNTHTFQFQGIEDTGEGENIAMERMSSSSPQESVIISLEI